MGWAARGNAFESRISVLNAGLVASADSTKKLENGMRAKVGEPRPATDYSAFNSRMKV